MVRISSSETIGLRRIRPKPNSNRNEASTPQFDKKLPAAHRSEFMTQLAHVLEKRNPPDTYEGFSRIITPPHATVRPSASRDSDIYREVILDSQVLGFVDKVRRTPEALALNSTMSPFHHTNLDHDSGRVHEFSLSRTTWDEPTRTQVRALGFGNLAQRAQELAMQPSLALQKAQYETIGEKARRQERDILDTAGLSPLTEEHIQGLIAQVIDRIDTPTPGK